MTGDSDSESSVLRPNFRTCGRTSSLGAPRKGPPKDRRGVTKNDATVPSIPSKLETILFSGDRERRGFGGQSLRFENSVADIPGPGSYSSEKSFIEEFSQKDSWGKLGTGGFASKTRRMPRPVVKLVPGPGAYAPVGTRVSQADLLVVPTHAKVGKTPAFVSPGSVNPQSFFEGPAPGPGHYHRKTNLVGRTNPWKASFESLEQRDSAAVPKDAASTPAPGEHMGVAKRPTSADFARKDPCFANASSKRLVSVHPDMPVPNYMDHLPKSDYVRECAGSVKDTVPPPGAYNQDLGPLLDPKDFCSLGSSAFQDTPGMVRSALGQSKSDSALMPGPGKYHDGIKDGLKTNAPTSMFQSTAAQRALAAPSAAPGPCFYNPKMTDRARSYHLNIKRRFMA